MQCTYLLQREKKMPVCLYSELINVLRIILCCEKEIWQRFMHNYMKSQPAHKSAKNASIHLKSQRPVALRMCPVNGWRIFYLESAAATQGQGIK